jgi:F-type H+-transporting ATPase subunit beta
MQMFEEIQLNVPLLRRRVPNLTVAARNVGLRPATVSNLCTGKIPLAGAEVRTLVALATLAGCSLDELVVRSAGGAMIETGIKVLDLFAPLVRGGTVGLVARKGLGQVVLLQELIVRVRQRGFATLVWTPQAPRPHMDEVKNRAEAAFSTLDEIQHAIEDFRSDRDVLVAADRSAVLTGELLALRERLQQPGARPVTFALVDALGEAADEELPYGPLETLWRFDPELAARGLYPAVDPITSTSTLLEGAQVEATHLTTQQRARKLLRRYRELRAIMGAGGPEALPGAEADTYGRGERLEAFLSQPLYVTEPYTKQPGAWSSPQETLDDVRRILDGGADHLPVASLLRAERLPGA